MLTPAECRLNSFEVYCSCRRCRVGRYLDLQPFIVSKYDQTPSGELWKRGLIVCRNCRSADCTVFISRVKVGTTEKLEVWG